MKPLGTPWSEDELATVVRMRQAGNSIARVAIVLERELGSVESKVGNLHTEINGPRKCRARPPVARRVCASRSELVTATLMGDPPPGRSALDQRQA